MSGARRLGPDDAEAILGIKRAGDLADLGEPDSDLASVLSDLSLPSAERIGVDDEQGLAGYAWTAVFPAPLAVEVEVRLRADADRAIGPALLELARKRAGVVGAGRPVQSWVHSTDTERIGWLAGVGAQAVRHYLGMVVELHDTPPAAPEAAADVEVVVVGDDEARVRAVYEIVEAAFADH